MEETKTAEETLKEKGIKDTLFLNGEWTKKGLSNLMNEFAIQQQSAKDELKKQNEELVNQIKNMYDLAERMGIIMTSSQWTEEFRNSFNPIMHNAERLIHTT